MPAVTMRELVASDLEVHGLQFVLRRYRKKVCFTHLHWLVFGYAPRAQPTPRPF